MSMLKEHSQSIAEDLAIEQYGMLFIELPKLEQVILFDKAWMIANNLLKVLTRNDER